ncbi:AAA family ATPase [Microbacterium immunditiarum]|uniref:Energy-coupling factor transporter ATP-binding protein EcfA2 n=1 Tax=Microbacterium immunditiarum TaxID=337480 RepID=A0A7Y9KI11_9MICO|nr:AAA family ATPase [Microbacterium immunditiarum]NYE18096.1 energy-coupling factor transporter ATP-binding protein EcfA2 [Microbacterium immunditiarum]
MRGGLERWKRGQGSQGVRQAVAYAFDGACDAPHPRAAGVSALTGYAEGSLDRFVVVDGVIARDRLNPSQLTRWVDGPEPTTGARRGRDLRSPETDLVLDGTINAPKSFSIAAMLHPELAVEFEALQDRLRDWILLLWQRELNARRGAGGRVRESLSRIEVVELRHRRSRALDPHVHRHLWLSVKVQGADGRWSNVDSRVAMRLHTLVNAEGELLARTDPRWRAALARFGYTIDANGEIGGLAHMVRPLSRRSNQIEANRAIKLAQWRAEHRGQEPGPVALRAIDRWAWAHARPDKPVAFAEEDWAAMIRGELATLGPPRPMAPSPPPRVGRLDRNLLAGIAVNEADQRAASTGGRFSVIDVRAGATRAVAATGVIADRAVLAEVIDDVTARGLALTLDLLPGESRVPAHLKHRMSVPTATVKRELSERFRTLSTPGTPLASDDLAPAAARMMADHALDVGQRDAAAAIAGTDRLVTIVGPAGTGKTTILRAAGSALAAQGRQMVVVAPTKKAAAVAAREVGTQAGSLHALLVDHGWRYAPDPTGRTAWRQLQGGERDPVTDATFGGPRRYMLRAGDRIVVDEAGMVDLDTARALAIVAEQTGAGIAMVGDPLQARPVGHSGAMSIMHRHSDRTVELIDVHRFRDPGYAALTLRLRDPRSMSDSIAAAAELADRGLVHRAGHTDEARAYIVDRYFHFAARRQRVAVVVGSNAEAQLINETIQQRRIDHGDLDPRRVVLGRDGQHLLVGDIVQTRRNDRHTGVDNRATWTITDITATGVHLASVTDPLDTRTVSGAYCAEDVHLSYASTVHGIQGDTTHASIVGPDVDAAGLYVGMTRGRVHNEVVTIARDDAESTAQVAAMMTRGVLELTFGDGVRAASSELGRAAREPEGNERSHLAETDPGTKEPWLARAASTALTLAARLADLDARTHAPRRTLEQWDELTALRRDGQRLRDALADATAGHQNAGDRVPRDRGHARGVDRAAPESVGSRQRSATGPSLQ